MHTTDLYLRFPLFLQLPHFLCRLLSKRSPSSFIRSTRTDVFLSSVDQSIQTFTTIFYLALVMNGIFYLRLSLLQSREISSNNISLLSDRVSASLRRRRGFHRSARSASFCKTEIRMFNSSSDRVFCSWSRYRTWQIRYQEFVRVAGTYP